MELNNVKTGFPSVIERAVKKDISDIVCMLLIEYDIIDRKSKDEVTKEKLYQKIMEKFDMGDAYCGALTKSGTKCTRRVQAGKSKYCGTHANMEMMEKMFLQKNNPKDHIIKTKQQRISNDVLSKMKKEFIEDSFFLVDDEFVYDKDTHEKVGYRENGEYVLTDDPFILNN
jgi:hypothetical protein